ncbi:MAG: hypothetical protein WA709_13800 [Stellaceae bacterium]
MTGYSRDLTLLTLGQGLSDEERRGLEEADVAVEERQVLMLAAEGCRVQARLCDGTSKSFDAVGIRRSAVGRDPT